MREMDVSTEGAASLVYVYAVRDVAVMRVRPDGPKPGQLETAAAEVSVNVVECMVGQDWRPEKWPRQ